MTLFLFLIFIAVVVMQIKFEAELFAGLLGLLKWILPLVAAFFLFAITKSVVLSLGLPAGLALLLSRKIATSASDYYEKNTNKGTFYLCPNNTGKLTKINVYEGQIVHGSKYDGDICFQILKSDGTEEGIYSPVDAKVLKILSHKGNKITPDTEILEMQKL